MARCPIAGRGPIEDLGRAPDHLADAASSGECLMLTAGSVFHLQRRVRVLVLGTNDTAKIHRLERAQGELVWICYLRRRTCGNAFRSSWSSDRTGERRWHFVIPQLVAAIALSAWFFVPHSNVALIAIFTFLGFGTVAYLPAFWALPSAFLTRSAAAAAVGFINCTASIGGFFGPKMIGNLSQQTGSFDAGFILMIACWTIAALLVPALSARARRLNCSTFALLALRGGNGAGIGREQSLMSAERRCASR
mgnify:CR=1 FL=1